MQKILLYYDASISHSNRDFDDLPFENWCSAQNVIVALMFFHSLPSSFDMIQKVWKVRTQINNIYFHNGTLLLSCIFIIDILGSLIMICIKYGYIVYLLYLAAVCVLTAGAIGVTLVCWLPCFIGIVYGILFLFRMLACNQSTEKPFGHVMNDIGGGITMNILSYLIVVLLLTFHWLFVGGPPESTIIFSSQSNAVSIFYLTTIGAIYGFIIALFGIVISALESKRTSHEELLMDTLQQ